MHRITNRVIIPSDIAKIIYTNPNEEIVLVVHKSSFLINFDCKNQFKNEDHDLSTVTSTVALSNRLSVKPKVFEYCSNFEI